MCHLRLMNVTGRRVGNDELVRMAYARPMVSQASVQSPGSYWAQNGTVRMPLADAATLSSVQNMFFLNEI